MRVHGGTEGGEVGEASGGKARECKDCIKSSHVTTEDNCVGATWSCEPGSQGLGQTGLSRISFRNKVVFTISTFAKFRAKLG